MSLREKLCGAWNLESFVARDVGTGLESHPLGLTPRGLITYTPDGHMSAQLSRSDMSEYIAYGGGFGVDERTATVQHEVTMATMPELLAAPQFRHAEVDGDRLVLSAEVTDSDGTASRSTLVWLRARPSD
ncbi:MULTISPECIES: lipocalin-like domain-containing protein [unclassified Mycobacterium]|uniref:lipocalin-like domain-containing protein n=1 Tax=unclassified Mycobacterium TaxID=2642494 RepID=UPI0029C77C75|nr:MULTISPECIES: lipocalin-like domain-containing protein [unclassified Mycobacterium]